LSGKINPKRTVTQAKKETERIILTELVQSSKRWGELLKSTGISSKTLKKGLDRMIETGDVIRTVEDQGYPPPVIYSLSKKAQKNIEPIVYGRSLPIYLNYFKEVWEPPAVMKDGSVQLLAHFEIPLKDKTLEEKLDLLIKRAGIVYVYSMLRAIQSNNYEWVDQAANNSYAPEFFGLNMGIYSDLKAEKQEGTIDIVDDYTYLSVPQITKAKINLKQLTQVIELLLNKYPEDIQELEKHLDKPSKSSVEKHDPSGQSPL
jgi:hypothetical protein